MQNRSKTFPLRGKRKKAAEAEVLTRSEQRYRSLFEQNFDACFMIDPQGRILGVNPACERTSGYTAEELCQMTFSQLCAPDQLQKTIHQLQASLKGDFQDLDTAMIHKNGSRVELQLTGGPIKVGGLTEGLFIIAKDITDRIRTQDLLRASEEQYRLLFAANPTPMWVFDEETFQFLAVNEAAVRHYGWSEAEFLKMSVLDIRPPEDRAFARAVIQQHNHARETGIGTVRHCRKNGALIEMEITVSSIPFAGRSGRLCLLADVTDRNRTQEALRASLDRLHLAYEAANAGSWEWDPQCNETVWSEQLWRLFGLDPRSCSPSYDAWLDSVHPDDRDRVSQVMRQAAANGAELTLEWRVLDPERGFRRLLSRGRPQCDDQGKVVRYVGIVLDITERKQAEEALGRRAEELDRLLDVVPAAVWVAHDPQCTRVTGNRRANEFYEAKQDENVSATTTPATRRFFSPEGRELAPSELPMQVAVATNQDVRDSELYVRLPSGRQIAMLGHAIPLRDQSGNVRGCIGAFMDISERRRAEDVLRQSEAQFRTLADSIPNLAWWADRDGYINWYNRRWYEYTGTTPEQMKGWGWQSVHNPEMLPSVMERWKASIGSGEPFEMEFPLRAADGQYHWFLTRVTPLRDASGSVVRWFGTNTDVSEARKAREVLARSKEELERLVAERTAKLQELVGELEHFSYTITHDMRAPLRAMRGFAEMMSDSCGNCGQHHPLIFLRRIAQSAERMDSLITDALNYSKAVRQEMVLEPVDAGALLRGMLDSYPELQPSKAQIEIQGEIPRVMGNEAGLTQCFSNFLGNAVKFVVPGTMPQVRIRAERRDGWVRLWFEDNGIGISEKMVPHVFKMFSRGSQSHEGTGIGLALVRKVMDRMGGKVGVESREGIGSRFWMDLRPGDPMHFE